MSLRILPPLVLATAALVLAGSGFVTDDKGAGDRGGSGGHLSPLDLVASPDGRRLYVIEHTGRSLALVDPIGDRLLGRVALPVRPTGLALGPKGARLYVTGGCPEGRILVIDTLRRKIVASWSVGHAPCAPVVGRQGRYLHCADRFRNRVITLLLGTHGKTGKPTGHPLRMRSFGREPVALALTPDNRTLVVASLLPSGAADGGYTAARVHLVGTATGQPRSSLRLPDGTTGVRGLALDPAGRWAYVTHILARYHLPATQLARGWVNTNALTVIDLAGQRVAGTVLLDRVGRGAANPWGVAVTADRVVVAHAGSHCLSLVDRKGLHRALAAARKEGRNPAEDLAFLRGLVRRVDLPGKGPRGVAVTDGRVFAAQYYSDRLAALDLEGGHSGPVSEIALGPSRPLDAKRLGELCFHDAALCFQEWQSCSSCHPDGRVDGLNWDLANDGLGNPKNTKSMLLAHATPPAMITGVRPDAEAAVRAGIRHIQLARRPEAEARAIDAWLRSLRPVPSPHLGKGKPSAAARRGAEIFKKARCVGCHPGPLYTDKRKHRLGLGGREAERPFDTPTLVELWRTAPYLYDGRAATLAEVIGRHNPGDRHGRTGKLSARERADLVEFLRSL